MPRTPSSKVCPRSIFTVSDEVKHLTPAQTSALEDAFRNWRDAAKRADSARARQRTWLIFLLLRHSGARLGEILSLDDRTAFDGPGPQVRVGSNGKSRTIPLAADVYDEISSALESPMGCGMRGTFFHADPGYFRRICYARGKECGLPNELSGPSVLRNTRAVELLRNGVPITVVKEVLGQSSLNLTAALQQFSESDVASIMHGSMRRTTSARNAFVGHVTGVVRDAVMAEVTLKTESGLNISAVITADSLDTLDIAEGVPVAATVKAPLVNVLAGGPAPAGSARNRLEGTVLRTTASPVLTEVLGLLPDGTNVCALVSNESAKELDLAPGSAVQFWFKALSVVLNTV